MAKPILVANWKNHPSSQDEVHALLKDLIRKKLLYKRLSVFIAPPLAYLESVADRAGKFAQLAAQDITELPKGTYTGVVTNDILKSFGVKLAIVGHSERRALGESSLVVSEKVKAALKSGIAPLVCVGEKTRDTDGEHFEFLRMQIKESLAGLSKQSVTSVLIAYEPSWAIGKSAKDAMPAGELAQSVIFIKKVLTDLYGRKVAESIPILYGGSVDPSNAGEIMREGGVKGLLVGRASLKAKSFEEIALSLLQK
ncbi:MAG: triose-phosphate isomerase [Candidatus Zambryskibacteria bacterium]|nr:triose-phosphate isomerase [Candidatus Zambryskibacteria bacterium]